MYVCLTNSRTMKVRVQYKVEVMVYREVDLEDSEVNDLKRCGTVPASDPLYSRLTDDVRIGMVEWWGDIECLSIFNQQQIKK